MSYLKIAYRQLISNPLSSILSIGLFALSIGLAAFILLTNNQFQDTMDKNLAGIDLIVGAKGSPLQMVLCNMYHVDAPTGNIQIDEVKAFLNPKHPLIKTAIPLSVGDNYAGYRIVGTITNFASLYNSKLANGNWWIDKMEVVIGHEVAENTKLKIGDHFKSAHGLLDDGMHSHDKEMIVTGILEKSSAVIDRLILTNTQTIWTLHEHEDEQAHEKESHEGHNHEHQEERDYAFDPGNVESSQVSVENEIQSLLDSPSKEITALLIQFKNRNHLTLTMGRSINENTNMQAAAPAYELSRLYSMVGTGKTMTEYLAWAIGFVSALSILFSLLQSLNIRKYELAIMRVMGATRRQLFGLVLLEGLLIGIIGWIIGICFAHGALNIMDKLSHQQYGYRLDWRYTDVGELYLLAISLLIAIIASFIPAYMAASASVSETLGAE